MAEYRISGELETGTESLLPLDGAPLPIKHSIRVEPLARAGGPTVAVDIDDDDLLEVELEDGFVLWTTADRLKSDAERAGIRERGDSGLPTQYPMQRRGRERGGVGQAIRTIKVLGYDLPQQGAAWVASKVENKLRGDGQFFRVSRSGELTREDPAATASDEPTLILIHGTASTTENAYSGFFSDNADLWSGMLDHYDGRAFAFEHRTLTKSPLENALEFLRAIPDNANLHLVTHSRGGLVGDLIAHGRIETDAFADEDLERELGRAFGRKPDAYQEQIERYREFNRLIRLKAPDVRRYVRVGCPAAGTTLASRRLDVYLSVMIHLLRMIPAAGPILGGLGELAAAVAKERTRPESLPGLEAQMPKSAFVRLLNGSAHVLETDLTVLAGDSDGLIKNLANLFYWRANDLVVDTRSMYGGAPRARRLWHLEENRHVTHVNYFLRPETARIVRRGLLRPEGDTAGFTMRRPHGVVRGKVKEGKPGENTNLPGVILLPGIMGSNLDVVKGSNSNRVWLDLTDLMRGRGELLAIDSGATIDPANVFDSPYEKFRNFLVRRNLHVMPLAYDWRLSLELAVERLDKLIKERLAASSEPVHLIAHSMGGLVASLLIARRPETWRRLRAGGGRMVQAGTPNRGSYTIPRLLQGKERMIRLIGMIDLEHDVDRWTHWASRFPGVLELAPSFGGPDFSKLKTWKDLKVIAEPQASDLSATANVRRELFDQTDRLADEGVLYIAGGPTDTPVFDPESGEIRFTERGDGRVTWDSGIPPRVPTWYIPVKHGSLLDKRSAFDGLHELLVDGHTGQLQTEPPAASSLIRGEPLETPLLGEDDQLDFMPSLQDLEEAALDMDPSYGEPELEGPPVMPCEISVVHGDLRFSSRPVVVGHYHGDEILHAEAALDRCLDGALRARYQLGVYPSAIGTAEVLLQKETREARASSPTGAIVLGLGNVGELSPGGLTRSVEAGLHRYAQIARERGLNTSSLKVSALIVGAGEAGISIAQSLEAFIAAVRNANQRLEKLRSESGHSSDAGSDADPHTRTAMPLAVISHIEFIEINEDLALQALHILSDLPERPDLTIRRKLVRRAGGQRRSMMMTAPPWWHRIRIQSTDTTQEGTPGCGDETEILRYTVYGERARAPVVDVVVQKRLVDRLVDEAIRDASAGRSKLPETLFELLVPQALKSGAADRRNLQLVLDQRSAAYPWELLTDRKSSDGGPVGIGSGLLRQLRLDRVDAVSHTGDNRILVVGDPPSGMQELPGARHEATAVAEQFERRGSWDVVRQIRGETRGLNASSIVQSLLSEDIRILHLAGHGIYDAARPMCSGMVIGGEGTDGDPYTLITAAEVRQMRLQPELVFINCCHLGRIEETRPFHRLAASIAAEFIGAGVKAVVAAGWPVNDEAAAVFCSEFYREMLSGTDFGNAVRIARRQTHRHESNTWGAYQCYGDPGLCLLMDRGVRARVAGLGRSDFLDSSELVIELGNLTNRARVDKSDEARQSLTASRDTLLTLAERSGWLSDEGVLVGFARIFGETKEFEKAIELYGRAASIEKGGVTLTDLEQLASYRTRHGEKSGDAKPIERAIRELRTLIDDHGETSERLSLVGAAHKRLVALEIDMAGNLRESTRAYTAAAEKLADNWYYPATNALLGVLLMGGPWRRAPTSEQAAENWDASSWTRRAVFDHKLDLCEAAIRRREIADFWDAVAIPDLEVIRALADGAIDERLDRLITGYRSVIDQFGSEREIDSVTANWNFAATTAAALGENALQRGLKTLCEALSR